ncbi:TIGR04222 domain-containing membrane protein [Streptomyces hypolithicus]
MTLLALLFTLAVVGSSITLTVGVSMLRRGSGAGYAHDDLMEIAFLSGGPARTVDTALATMYADGRLAIGGPGVVSPRSTVARDPVERAVLAELAAAPNGALHHLRHAVMRGAAVQEIGDSLAFRGLMVAPRAGRTWRLASTTLLLTCMLGFPAAVAVTVVESSADAFGVPFIVKVLPALFLGVIFGAVNAARAAARVTPAGRAVIQSYRVSHADWTGSGHLVAVNGLRGLPDLDLQEQLRAAARLSPRGARATSGTDSALYGTTVDWCSGSGPGGSGCGGGSGDSGSGSGCGSGSGSGGSSCGGSSGGSSCGSSSSGSSCGGGGSS